MKKNIIIVTLNIILVVLISAYWYNKARVNQDNNLSLTEQLDEAAVRMDRLVQSQRDAVDTANHYRALAAISDHKVDSLMDKTVEYEQEINDIPNIIAKVTPNQAYDSLQNYIPVATGKLEYGFDSTQVKDLYADELKLEKLEPMVITLGETVTTQEIQIGHLKKEVAAVRTAVDTCNARADIANERTDLALDRVEEVETNLKWWKRGSIVVVITVIIAAVF
jgi:hypothetical protein